MSIPVLSAPLDEITTAVLDLLRIGNPKIYDGAYSGNPIDPDGWYGVLYRILGGDADPLPDFDGNPQTLTVAYQVTTFGATRNQAEKGARICRDLLLGRAQGGWAFWPDMPAGWRLADRRLDAVTPGIDRGGEPPNAVFSLPARYLLTITPA